MDNVDIVYVVKHDEHNLDLKYSLRSLAYVTGYRKIWIAGYKPSWVSDLVGSIPVEQLNVKTKWMNSVNNIKQACYTKEVTDNFVLFNDDFFAARIGLDIRKESNYYRGTIDQSIERYNTKDSSRWRESFTVAKEILTNFHCTHFDNFALHVPMLLNKYKVLTLLNNFVLSRYTQKHKMLPFRNIYGNLYWNHPQSMRDGKIVLGQDITDERLEACKWISVPDNVTDNLMQYPKLYSLLKSYPASPYITDDKIV